MVETCVFWEKKGTELVKVGLPPQLVSDVKDLDSVGSISH